MPDADTNWKPLYTIGAVAALVQLAAVLAYAVALATLGPSLPARRSFLPSSKAAGCQVCLRGDFLLLVLIAGYLGTFPRCMWLCAA